ncbi:carbohydrate ABC transporter permease [Deinococcus roseus]|uniref:Sugar ABC transporter permease n=1 Tax=Deinococcus roseus TaxID=392414 RepID=A0ABQ2D2I4_9DEIO|nr:sugar ABC transporter permease [Deinococcus roseus]GGJ43313.1 sugar ABC transporter permease [Deinococcus roseus]
MTKKARPSDLDGPTLAPLTARKSPSQDSWLGYLFILPGILGFLLFVAYPLVTSGYYALTEWNGATEPRFIGFENFRYLFQDDPSFWPSLKATGLFMVLSVPSGLLIGLLLAVLVNRNLPGIRMIRTVLYLPVVLPAVASLTLWKFIYNPDFGLANQMLGFLHLPTRLWLGDVNLALPSLVLIGLWGAGGSMVIFLAGLQAVPKELYEAATLDGANPTTTLLKITMPMMSPILFMQLITGMISALQAFSQAQILTRGGPNLSTNFLMYDIYVNAFENQQFGLATAQCWVLLLLIVALTVLVFRFSSTFVFAENEN